MNTENKIPPFERWVSAKQVMERYEIDHVALRQKGFTAYIQTGPVDFEHYTCNFQNLKKFTPVFKSDFEEAVYDIFELERYEFEHPEIIKNPHICPHLEEVLHPTKKREREEETRKLTKNSPKQKPIKKGSNKDIAPWVKCVENYCITQKKKRGQLPAKEDVFTYLELQLKQENKSLGDHSILPDTVCRKIWKAVHKDYKRARGEKNK